MAAFAASPRWLALAGAGGVVCLVAERSDPSHRLLTRSGGEEFVGIRQVTSNTHARRIGEKLGTPIAAIPLGATREEAGGHSRSACGRRPALTTPRAWAPYCAGPTPHRIRPRATVGTVERFRPSDG